MRRLGVWERRTKPECMETGEDADHISTNNHDYSTAPQPAFVLEENESLRKEIIQLRQQLEQLSLKQSFGFIDSQVLTGTSNSTPGM